MKRQAGPTAGFTLIELLVVIAIIAILAAILFPVFARARAKAQQADCLSNVKELQLSLLMYVSDYDNVLPNAWYGTGATQYSWLTCIFPYTKNAQIALCPSDATPFNMAATWGCPVDRLDYGATPQTSYGMNGDVFATLMAVIQYPAECFGISDNIEGFALNGWPPYFVTGGTTFPLSGVNARHNLGLNMSYMDGHAAWVNITTIPNITATVLPGKGGPTFLEHFYYGQD